MRRRSIVCFIVLVAMLPTASAFAWCIDNATPFELMVQVPKQGGFQTRLASRAAFCAPEEDPRFNWMRDFYRGGRAIEFKLTYQDSAENAVKNKDIIKALANLGRRTFLKAPLPVAIAPGLPIFPVCDLKLMVGDTLTVAARPGKPSPYDRVAGTTPVPQWKCTVTSGDRFPDAEPEIPQNVDQCRVQYHECAARARNCATGDCPSDYECQTENNACTARVTGTAPAPASNGEAWAAIAVDGVAQITFEWGHASEQEARDAAIQTCRDRYPSDPDSCQVKYTFRYERNRCVASAAQDNGSKVYYADGRSRSAAEQWADRYCRKDTGDSCDIDWSYCTDSGGGLKPLTHYFGAIAAPHFGQPGHPVIVTDAQFYDASSHDAEELCRKENHLDQCDTVVQFARCAAYADTADHRHSYWGRGEELRDAEENALRTCNKDGFAGACVIVVSGCTQRRD